MFDYSARGGFINLRFTAYESALAFVNNRSNSVRDSGSSTLLTFP
jgi:hypothetical protein